MKSIKKFIPYKYEDEFCPRCKVIKSNCICDKPRRLVEKVELSEVREDGSSFKRVFERLEPIKFKKERNPNRYLIATIRNNTMNSTANFVGFKGQENIFLFVRGGTHIMNFSIIPEELIRLGRTFIENGFMLIKNRKKTHFYDKKLRMWIPRPRTYGQRLELEEELGLMYQARNYANKDNKKKSGRPREFSSSKLTCEKKHKEYLRRKGRDLLP